MEPMDMCSSPVGLCFSTQQAHEARADKLAPELSYRLRHRWERRWDQQGWKPKQIAAGGCPSCCCSTPGAQTCCFATWEAILGYGGWAPRSPDACCAAGLLCEAWSAGWLGHCALSLSLSLSLPLAAALLPHLQRTEPSDVRAAAQD